jgi:hypothetical protein
MNLGCRLSRCRGATRNIPAATFGKTVRQVRAMGGMTVVYRDLAADVQHLPADVRDEPPNRRIGFVTPERCA